MLTPPADIPFLPEPLTIIRPTPSHLHPGTSPNPRRSASDHSTRRSDSPSSHSLHRNTSVRTERSREKFHRVLQGKDGGGIDIAELKGLAWNGIPDGLRPVVWQLLLVSHPRTHSTPEAQG